jgi:hypothetical protein
LGYPIPVAAAQIATNLTFLKREVHPMPRSRRTVDRQAGPNGLRLLIVSIVSLVAATVGFHFAGFQTPLAPLFDRFAPTQQKQPAEGAQAVRTPASSAPVVISLSDVF